MRPLDPTKPYTPLEEILRLLRETELTCKQIEELIGRSNGLVTVRVKRELGITPTEYRKQHGWVGGKRGRGVSPARQKQIVTAYRSGARVASLKGGKGSVKAILDGEERCDVRRYLLPEETIVKRYKDGESTVALAAAFRVNEASIRRLLDRHDVPRRGNTSRAGRALWKKPTAV